MKAGSAWPQNTSAFVASVMLKFKACLLVLKKALVNVILLRSDLILEHIIAKKIEG